MCSIPLKDMALCPGARTHRLPAEGRSHSSLQSPGVSPDSRSKTRMFPHLMVRHDIERFPVQGEGHVPEDGAAILHHSHCLVQHSPLQRTVRPDLQRHRQIQEAVKASLQDTIYCFWRGTSVVYWISLLLWMYAPFWVWLLPLSLKKTGVVGKYSLNGILDNNMFSIYLPPNFPFIWQKFVSFSWSKCL